MKAVGLMSVAFLSLVLSGIAPLARNAHAGERQYFIRAEEVDWDYAPVLRNLTMGRELSDEERAFVAPSPSRIGHVYRKIVYRGYTTGTFDELLKQDDPSLGFLGPVIRAEVGDTIRVTFRNDTSKPLSIHPHGVLYKKEAEGSMTNDGTDGKAMMDDSVEPGATYVYNWSVPERAGPTGSDPSSVVWLYHSHVDEVRDTNTGTVGAIVVTRQGMARPDGSPKDVDREVFSFFSIVNENESLFAEDMKKKLASPPGESDSDFEESNLMHSINGYVFGNMPMPTMKVGEHVRWYVMSLGTEADLHTPHWHGNTVVVRGHREDVVELLPASTVVADMVPDNPGIWMYHCHVNDHIEAGMTGRYEVK